MYAVLVTGGKQYRVMKGETLRVEKLDAEAGKEVTFDNILMLGDGESVTLGDALKSASVSAKIVGHGRADKGGAGLRRRWCRTPARTCPSRTAR